MGPDHYDPTVGSGPGNAALAQRLAHTGKRILLLERENDSPRSEPNWNAPNVFVDRIYQTKETWTNAFEPYHPEAERLFDLFGQCGEDPLEP